MVMTDVPQWAQLISPIATAIGVIVAAWSIYTNTKNAKKRGTIDMIVAERNNSELQKAVSRVNQLAKQNKECIYAAYISEDEKFSEDRAAILKVLNHREFMSVAILGGALDEKIYKSFQYSMHMRDWDNLSGFVTELRNKKQIQTMFQEFECLAKRWKKKPLKEKKK
ncbi:protein of unknown function [Snodgrassella sp. R-53583]|nr:protein of unknown function [Snodgrassella sp. R-53583]